MLSRSSDAQDVPRFQRRLAVIIFVFTLLAFVVESQLTQYVQTNLGYRHPFFLFYMVHSSFSLIFPLHLLYLRATTPYSTSVLLSGLQASITKHLDPKSPFGIFPIAKFLKLVVPLTIGITLPGLLWFAAISLASVSDVTAIWNTNAFFAYLISVRLFKLQWEPRKLFAVTLATLGTVAVVYGGVSADEPSTTNGVDIPGSRKPTTPLLGNLLTLMASFLYGLYQVLYKIYAALPNDPELASDVLYEQILDEEEADGRINQAPSDIEDGLHTPPFGLHPNFLTSVMGLITFAVLWIPLPFLHWSGAEPFEAPPNMLTVISIAGIALGGVVFNAGFMVLLGIWGPIVTSVGGLLTIVLMLISDTIFGSGLESLTLWSLLGSSVIVFAFGVLAYDMYTKQRG